MREDLTDEDMNRLDNVRKQIWAAGYTGFFIGGAWGLGNCIIYKGLQAKAVEYFPKHPAIKSLPVLQNKHFVMWSLVAAATGMFMGAGMGGIRGNEDLRDIYDRRTGGGLTEQQYTRFAEWMENDISKIALTQDKRELVKAAASTEGFD